MKFSVGDMVQIKNSLTETHQSPIGFSSKMLEFRGEVRKIIRVNSRSYVLDGINQWYWDDGMVEAVDKDALISSYFNGKLTDKELKNKIKHLEG